ncbi:hypothetical protein AUK04_01005 [Candidatus Roizmanbacteria bacterium CG2_30_33_16]|uniref:Uncharacterized protein n=5 Tax=Candidatus Roizmaniibacteriota TaxID=1752723 RepID=A0A2H0C2F6_9BACT|nr:hypothetical protein [Candidatus Roizmanbacteria bacterium]OIP85649.1 MAG: hypothetical protein AUK04_01005 [Candidatus Roizmanbacteria bacterium CG2_30_33_16]PIP63939.1 MAG: hypothetical protein COW96_05315 [Candidatus Roizmanbacteria bacterium CG22_combo_CG10-13_8_21_14_all_33_16]PIX70445.1 MAG: hypothetical protein COZ39_04495 [Candidatus Roizmanbacteria bacterium CG_4_10_14_3_um_filter_33_21]
MKLNNKFVNLPSHDFSIEVVEHKGRGNPSMICDLLINHLTTRLATIYKDFYQTDIDFDLSDSILLAGETIPDFQGSGSIFKPMVFILGGWATDEHQGKRLNFDYLIRSEIYTFLKENYRFLHENNFFIKNAVKMIPAKLIPYLTKNNVIASDEWVAMGIGGYTVLEKIVLSVNKYLDSLIKNSQPEIGEDIVIKGTLEKSSLKIKIDLALVDYYVKNKTDYKLKINDLKNLLEKYVKRQYSQKVNIIINAQLTITGTTIENMNFGRVGDGNLNNGLISYIYPQAMKMSYGKHPSHISRTYQKIAQTIANQINIKLNKRTFVWLYADKNLPVSQPKLIHVQIADYQIKDNPLIERIINKNFSLLSI